MEESKMLTVIELSSDEEPPKKEVKKKLKTLRKDNKQPVLKNYFQVKNENYFSTHKKSSLPIQVNRLMLTF